MKHRIFVPLLLTAALMLSLFTGCGPAESGETTEGPKQSKVLSVGFGKVDVTPTESVPMNGLDSPTDRMSEDVRDPLYLSCIAFTDEFDSTVIMFAVESLYTYDVMRFGAKDIEKETGVPYSNIMFGSDHSHSSPSISTYDYNMKPTEVYGISMTEYAPGTAEVLQDAFVTMLNTLYETK